MYYYRGMIYLDYIMMASMDAEILKELEGLDDAVLESASFGSLKKCIELDTKKSMEKRCQQKN